MIQKVYIQDYGMFTIQSIETQSINAGTPQTSFVNSHFTDIRKECGALKAVLTEMPGIKSIADIMAGSGFSGAIFQSTYPTAELFLSDFDQSCVDNIMINFGGAKSSKDIHICCADAREWKIPKKVDLVFIDFNTFTLKKIEQWRDIVIKWNHLCHNLIICDSACFGFAMGNLKTYGVASPKEYYDKVRKALNLDKKRVTFCMAENAALILFQKGKESIKEIPAMNLSITKLNRNSLDIF